MRNCITWLLLSILVVGAAPCVRAIPVETGFGSLKIGGILQGWYYYTDEENIPNTFKIKRARLIFSGVLLNDKLKFFVQTEMLNSPTLLDAKLQLFYIPKTELAFGRFVPAFTLYMPTSTAKLDFINYPLLTTRYAMWRQTGIQSTTRWPKAELTLGLFNGYQGESAFNAAKDETNSSFKGDDWSDENDAKDFLLRVDCKPVEGLLLAAYYWGGNPGFVYTGTEGRAVHKDYHANRWGAFAEWRKSGLHAVVEYAGGRTEKYLASEDDAGEVQTDLTTTDSYGYYLQAGYMVAKSLELLARYDGFDANRDVGGDRISWLTLGLNYDLLPEYHTRASLNYVIKNEESNGIDNNELIVQLQYFF